MRPFVRSYAARPRGSGAWRVLRFTRHLARRYVSKLLCLLAVVGVPIGVIAITGGAHTIGLWVVALVWLAAVVYGGILVSFMILLVLSPLVLLAERTLPERSWEVMTKVVKILMLLAAGVVFVMTARLGDTSGVRLPGPHPGLGALAVIAAAIAVSHVLLRLARRWRPEGRPPAHERRHSVSEPDDEYWSDRHVVAWRAWNWDGSSLRGVHSRWPADTFEATCSRCESVPSWHHVCGVYAVKRPADVHVFHGGSWIVGRVEMWGDVIEHEYGYRASHARITHLWVGDPWRAERIDEAYPMVDVAVGSPHAKEEVV